MSTNQHIYIKDGTTAYMFNAYVGCHPKTGKNAYRVRQGFKTKKAQIVLAEILKNVAENGLNNKPSVLTFKQHYEKWLVQVKAFISRCQ
ncbi:Arm DNA-binding domain-containing protein [Enterococcus faecalis]|uniref:Arm DNA-binding domain-containing protein n=1 Tax=Enterococcus faecalis TaxID=1351 RepID=UPI000E0517B8|nr:Arm DNA-binding domain-containing protein [Enterococcus faecalis]MDB1624968.1 Arm DNA-binding domain-containing protein [Enterococcus faecalis]RBR47139.1 hypothetical protein EB28_01355 [Enterococcus faecalis]